MLLLLGFLLVCPSAHAADKILDIQEVTSDKGLTAWLAEDHSLPVVALTFTFLDSGTALDPAEKQGLVRMLSNTMDEGAGDLDSQSFQKELSDNSISLLFSAGRDGFGGNLKTLARNKDKAFELLRMALTSPRFDDEPVARMRAANMARIRSSLSDPEWVTARILNDRMFDGHPYAMNSGGSLTSLAKITTADLKRFHQTYLARDRLLISVAGDITADELKARLDTVFGALPAAAPKNAQVADTAIQNTGEVSLYDQDVPQTVINIALPAFGRDDPAYYPLRVMNYLFGEAGFGSRLMEEVREKRGLTYGIYSNIQNFRHADVLTISTSTKNSSARPLLDVVDTAMKDLATTPVSEQELKDAKSYLTGSVPLSLSSTGSIAAVMMSLQIEGLPADYLDHYAEKINEVTAEEIRQVAQRILNPEKMTVVLVGQPTAIVPTNPIKEIPNAE